MEKHRRQCTLCERFVEIRQEESAPWEDPAIGLVTWFYVVHYRKKSREICPSSSTRTSPPMTKRFEFA